MYVAALLATGGGAMLLHAVRAAGFAAEIEPFAAEPAPSDAALLQGIAGIAALLLACFLTRGTTWRWRNLLARLHEDRATASVSFVLTLPIFLFIVAVIIQSALIANAQLMVNYAAFAAARSAATSLADGYVDHPRRAAALVLAPLSPQGRATPTGEQARQAMLAAGAAVPRGYAGRFSHALDAVSIIRPALSDRSRSPSELLKMEISYRFILKVPAANLVLKPGRITIGGVSGRYLLLHASSAFQSSPGRDTMDFSPF